MGQSLSQLYIHLTFGTKDRFPFIQQEYEEHLHKYIAGTLRQYDSPAIIVNSVSDHLHVLFRLSKNFALAKIVEEVKKQSSKWMKELRKGNSKFSWQSGYGAFSVSSSKIEVVKKYITHQKEHHRKHSYQEEVEEFLKNYNIIEYDPEYFWN